MPNSVFIGSNNPSSQLLSNGSASFPSLGFASESALGFFRNAAGQITSTGVFLAPVLSAQQVFIGGLGGPSFYGVSANVFQLINGSALGIAIDVAADLLKIRNAANSAYATIDALGYSVSGVAGASKVAGPVTSITVVNGIVTACT